MTSSDPTDADHCQTSVADRPDEGGLKPTRPDELAARLERIEKLLGQIRGALDAESRAGQHRDLSPARMIGAVLQVVVGGLVALALLDWILQDSTEPVLIKLAFAAVLQLAALTAFVLAGPRPWPPG